MNDSRFHHHPHQQSIFHDMNPSSFFRSRFPETRYHHHDTFFNDTNDAINDEQQHQQPKVHHIPIQIEPRTSGGMANNALRSQSNRGSREQSPMPPPSPPPLSSSNADYQQQKAQHLNQQPPQCASLTPPPPLHFQQQQHQPQQLPIKNEQSFARSSDSSPRMVRSIPIQISKSNSSPSTTNERPQSSSPQQQQQQNIPVNESSSDPTTLADPNKVYAMSYEPIIRKNVSTPESILLDEEMPKVVPLSYEPVIQCKQAVNQQTAAAAAPTPPSFSSNDGDNGQQLNEPSTSQNQQQQQQRQQQNTEKKEETPFDYIDEILYDLRNWEQQVHECQATTADDKGYKWLDEMLTLCVLRLDCIDIDGDEELRKYRKQAINEVNRVVALLESKLQHEKDSKSNNVEHDDDKNESIINEDDDDSVKKTKDEKIDKKKDGKRTFKIFSRKSNKPSTSTSTSITASDSKDTDKNNNDLKSNNLDQSANNSSMIVGRETEV